MFAEGDRVVYPLHGGAVIKAIEKRSDGDEVKEYFVLQMLFDKMQVSVPVSNAEKVGLRYIATDNELDKVAEVLQIMPNVQSIKSISWNRRFHVYMNKIRTGNILEVAEVFKILISLEKDKKISVGERRLLHNTKQILESEIMLIRDCDAEKAEMWLKSYC